MFVLMGSKDEEQARVGLAVAHALQALDIDLLYLLDERGSAAQSEKIRAQSWGVPVLRIPSPVDPEWWGYQAYRAEIFVVTLSSSGVPNLEQELCGLVERQGRAVPVIGLERAGHPPDESWGRSRHLGGPAVRETLTTVFAVNPASMRDVPRVVEALMRLQPARDTVREPVLW